MRSLMRTSMNALTIYALDGVSHMRDRVDEMSKSRDRDVKRDTYQLYYLLFFLSGFPALLYQIVWQRALFTLYGVNIESVTMIVTVFMLGLGVGSLAGGWLSTRAGIHP